MSETFKTRVRDEIEDFSEIYANFRDGYDARLKEHETRRKEGEAPQGEDVVSVYRYLFEIPFDSPEYDEPAESSAKLYRHDAVIRTVRDLEIHKLPLGPLLIEDSRGWVALDLGLLPSEKVVSPGEYDGFARRLKPERDDPFFWRALIEFFCRVYVAKKGPKPWPLIKKIDLAFDLDEIRRTLPDKVWNEKEVRKQLNEKKEYTKKYPRARSAAGQAGVGEDRIREITAEIGPMDNQALNRLKRLYPDEFFMVADARAHRRDMKNSSIENILVQAENALEVLDRPTPSDKTNPDGNG